MEAGVICLCPDLLPLAENMHIIPVGWLLRSVVGLVKLASIALQPAGFDTDERSFPKKRVDRATNRALRW